MYGYPNYWEEGRSGLPGIPDHRGDNPLYMYHKKTSFNTKTAILKVEIQYYRP